jgi:hypothetical protein
MRLAQPPGVRATRDGGEWEICRDGRGATWMMRELEALCGRLGDHQAAMLRAELRDKMKRAAQGTLTYGSGRNGDVELMAATRDVLELRLTSRSGADGDSMHIRLFFSEPDETPALLCALMLLEATWPRGPGGTDCTGVDREPAS